ncbi:MAG: YihY/virulence factor BrkB family protein [Acidimicrobiales bacterium]
MSREGGWHRSVGGIVRRTVEAAYENNVPFLASALSFDLLLTALPFIALLLAVAGALAQYHLTTQQIELSQLVERFLPPDARVRGVEEFIGGVLAQRARLTLIGVPLFLWFSTRLFGGLRAALNDVFDTDENRPWPLAKLMDLAMVIITGALVMANALLSGGVAWLAAASRVRLGDSFALSWFWRGSFEVLALGFSVLLFFLIFKFVPGRWIYWRTALVAAGFCAAAVELAKWLYTGYLTRFATLDHLASDANVVAFLLFFVWIYYTAYVFLLGGIVAETYDLIRLRRAQRVGLA